MIAFPAGGVLFPADPVESILLAPVTLTQGPLFTYNLVQILHVGLAAAALSLLARAVTGTRGVGLAVASALAFSPVLLCTAHNGNPDVGQFHWIPLAGWAACRSRESLLYTIVTGVITGISLISNIYVGVMSAVLAVGLLLAGGCSARRMAVAAGTALAISGPVLAFAAWLLSSDASIVEKSQATVRQMRGIEGSADVLGFIVPGLRAVPDPRGGESAYLNGWGAGWILCGLALLRARRPDSLDRWLWAVVGVGVLLAMGPVLKVANEPVTVGSRHVPLPFVLLDLVPPFSLLIELWRFSALVQVGLALLASRALAGYRPGMRVAVGVALSIEFLSVQSDARAWQVDMLPDEGLAEIVEGLPDGPILSFPARQGDWPLWYQTIHHRPVANSPMNVGDPSIFAVEAQGTWSLDELRGAARAAGYRWVLLHMRAETRNEQPMDDVFADARDAGLVVRTATNLALLDLESPDAWPTRRYASRGLVEGRAFGDSDGG